jgi:hypothetical protein
VDKHEGCRHGDSSNARASKCCGRRPPGNSRKTALEYPEQANEDQNSEQKEHDARNAMPTSKLRPVGLDLVFCVLAPMPPRNDAPRVTHGAHIA